MSSLKNRLSDDEIAEISRASATELSKLLASNPDIDRVSVHLDGTDMILPAIALRLLRDLLAEMAQGNTVTVVPRHAELTTQEAASLLNVSRPFLIKLLEQGRIPYMKVGTHRRIMHSDLAAYQAEQKRSANALLDELVEEAQEQDLGY